jgi:YHS domain-containing protein
MAAILIRILYMAAIFWLLRRFLGSFLKPPRAAKKDPNTIANFMVKDPVCGMYMDSRLALKLEKKNLMVYFCSEKCKQNYLETGKTE